MNSSRSTVGLVAPLRWVILVVAALAAACASGSKQLVDLPSQEVELTRPDLCRIYVLRSSQLMGAVRTMRVFDQDQEIGTLGTDEYLCWERPAGRTLVRALYEGPEIDRGDQDDLYDLQAEAGTVVYLSVSLLTETEPLVSGGGRGSPKLKRLSREEGRDLVKHGSPAGR